MCRMIRPARIGKSAFLRCRAMARSGGCQTPWTFFLPYRPDGSPCSNFFYDRQGSLFRRFCRRPLLANPSVIMGVHIQKSTKSNWVPYGPQSVFLCLYFCVYSIFASDCYFTIRFLANFVSPNDSLLSWFSVFPADSMGQTTPLSLSFRPTMLRPKYNFSLPYGAVSVNLRFSQGQGREHGAGHCEDTMMANWVLCSSVAAEGTIKLNYF